MFLISTNTGVQKLGRYKKPFPYRIETHMTNCLAHDISHASGDNYNSKGFISLQYVCVHVHMCIWYLCNHFLLKSSLFPITNNLSFLSLVGHYSWKLFRYSQPNLVCVYSNQTVVVMMIMEMNCSKQMYFCLISIYWLWTTY